MRAIAAAGAVTDHLLARHPSDPNPDSRLPTRSVPSYAGPPTAARAGDVAGTLRLLAYLALSLTLIVLDHRGGWLTTARRQATVLVQPLWAVAGWPGRVAERVSEDAGTLAQLTEENRELRRQALLDRVRMARMQTIAADNTRLRTLLDAAQRGRLDAQLAPILDIDLDPTRQRLVLDAGRGSGVREGQTVIDAGGLLGQVVDVTPLHSTVLLVTDSDHAVPVAIARNGVRLVVYGRGRTDLLALASVPLSSDIKVGDVLVTSGLGGRFPPGFAVGTVTALGPDPSRAFLVGDVKPAAQLDRGRDVLLLRSAPPHGVIGPDPEPVRLPVAEAAAKDAKDQKKDTAPVAPAVEPRLVYPPAACACPAASSTQAGGVATPAGTQPATASGMGAGAAPLNARVAPLTATSTAASTRTATSSRTRAAATPTRGPDVTPATSGPTPANGDRR